MKTRNIFKHKFIAAGILGVLFAGLTSCSVERKLAKAFIEETEKPAVVLKKPKKFYMVSYRETGKDTTGMKSWQVDSVRFHESKFLQYLDEEKLRNRFNDSFYNEMSQLGFKVYQGKEVAPLIGNDTVNPLVISFPQMELNEYTELYRDRGMVGNKVFYKSFDLDALYLNTWLKISPHRSKKQNIFFIQDSITDVIDGYFERSRKTQQVKYRYEEHQLEKGDVYRFMSDMGRNYAQYVYDYYLNRFIDGNINKREPRRFMYHYNPKNQEIMLIRKLPWTEMDPKSTQKSQ